MIFSLN